MPKAPSRCGRDGCRNLNPCPLHPKGWASAKAQANPLPAGWDSLITKVASRDGKKCAICGSKERPELDHIIPRAVGGSNDPSNLRFLCHDCHNKKTGDDARERRARERRGKR